MPFDHAVISLRKRECTGILNLKEILLGAIIFDMRMHTNKAEYIFRCSSRKPHNEIIADISQIGFIHVASLY